MLKLRLRVDSVNLNNYVIYFLIFICLFKCMILYYQCIYYILHVKTDQSDADDESDEGYEESDPLTNIDQRLSSVSVTADQNQV